jgi:hypothetical protein
LMSRGPDSRLGWCVEALTGPLSAAAVLAVALLAIGLSAGAQTATTVPTPFPRPILGFVPVPASGPADPALAIRTVAVGEGSGIGSGGTRSVKVGFAGSFPLPTERYRVSVVWGVPGGAETRASFVSSSGTPSGTVESSTDGRTWADGGITRATFADDSVSIDAPLGGAATGSGLWVEAQLGEGTGAGNRTAASSVFSLDALIGQTTTDGLPATSWGRVESTDAAHVAAPLAFGNAPPTLRVDNQALVVVEPSAAPTIVGGQAVTDVVDEVTFVPGYTPSGTASGVIQIDRTTGVVRAFRGVTGLPEDRTGDGSWVMTPPPPPPASATGPVTVTMDLPGISRALDLPLDADGTGLGLRRKITLANGSVVVGLPVTATLGWMERAGVPTDAPPGSLASAPVSDPAARSGSGGGAALIAAVVAAVALGALGMGLARRRRHRQSDRFTAEILAPPVVVDRKPEPVPEPVPGRSPAEALAAFEAQVDVLTARVDRLGQPGSKGSGQMVDASRANDPVPNVPET